MEDQSAFFDVFIDAIDIAAVMLTFPKKLESLDKPLSAAEDELRKCESSHFPKIISRPDFLARTANDSIRIRKMWAEGVISLLEHPSDLSKPEIAALMRAAEAFKKEVLKQRTVSVPIQLD